MFISNKIGFISNKDIIVYKRLKKTEEGYKTLVQGWPVSFDSLLVPDEGIPEIGAYGGYKLKINGGVIHSFTKSHGKDCFKAIIKEGTRFWVQDDLEEIAAEKLYLTSEEITSQECTDMSILYGCWGADVLLKDGSRISILDAIGRDDIKGIFAYDNQAVGIELFSGSFHHEPLESVKYYPHFYKIGGDLNGLKLTEDISETDLTKKLPSGTYLPSAGELKKAFGNLLSINITRKALGLEAIGFDWFWSSTMGNKDSAYCIHSSGFWCAGWRLYNTSEKFMVLPFLK